MVEWHCSGAAYVVVCTKERWPGPGQGTGSSVRPSTAITAVKRAQHGRPFVFPSNCFACSDSLFGGGAIGIVNNVFKLILLVTYLTLLSSHVL